MSEYKYFQFMEELTDQDIYEGLLGYGLFSDKLPPILESNNFYNFCKNNPRCCLSQKEHSYIKFESMRNTNVPREFGIPHPFAYNQLCKFISTNWTEIKNYFYKQTMGQKYRVSRIHIRKMKNTKSIFQMNYDDWRKDGVPELDLKIGAKYEVKADISTCFPSIYSHALAWAIVGKDKAKETQDDDSLWYNILDRYTRNLQNNETHGVIIGPHASNILSEIILTKIDNELKDKKYIRNIDDYTCYVKTFEEGQKFIADLSRSLRGYGLSLNNKKTSIKMLPLRDNEDWLNQLSNFTGFDNLPSFRAVQFFLDTALKLMEKNDENAAILKYAMKVISSNGELTKSAIVYYIKTIFHLTIVYPYLVTSLEDCLFSPFGEYIEKDTLVLFLNDLYEEGEKTLNYEAMYYSIYFSLHYKKRYDIDIDINGVTFENVKKHENCLLMLFAYLYFKERNLKKEIKLFKDDANSKKGQDEYWLYSYEVLSASELSGDWKYLKKNKVSFVSWET